MTDLTPEQTEAVRRLLAEARADKPMPAEVAARLDGVLAELNADRTSAPDAVPLAPVVPIRRRWPAVLLAAAAVTAIAFGATQVLGPQSADDAGTAAEDAGGAGDDKAADRELAPDAANAPSPTSVAPSDLGYANDTDVTDSLSSLVEAGARVLDGPWLDVYLPDLTPVTGRVTIQEAPVSEPRGETFNGTTNSINRLSGTSCGPLDPFPLSTAYAALYRDHAALVVVLPPIDGRHTVQVFDCQGTSPRLAVETVTVPVGQLPPGE